MELESHPADVPHPNPSPSELLREDGEASAHTALVVCVALAQHHDSPVAPPTWTSALISGAALAATIATATSRDNRSVVLGIDVATDRLNWLALDDGGEFFDGDVCSADDLARLSRLADRADVIAIDAPGAAQHRSSRPA